MCRRQWQRSIRTVSDTRTSFILAVKRIWASLQTALTVILGIHHRLVWAHTNTFHGCWVSVACNWASTDAVTCQVISIGVVCKAASSHTWVRWVLFVKSRRTSIKALASNVRGKHSLCAWWQTSHVDWISKERWRARANQDARPCWVISKGAVVAASNTVSGRKVSIGTNRANFDTLTCIVSWECQRRTSRQTLKVHHISIVIRRTLAHTLPVFRISEGQRFVGASADTFPGTVLGISAIGTSCHASSCRIVSKGIHRTILDTSSCDIIGKVAWVNRTGQDAFHCRIISKVRAHTWRFAGLGERLSVKIEFHRTNLDAKLGARIGEIRTRTCGDIASIVNTLLCQRVSVWRRRTFLDTGIVERIAIVNGIDWASLHAESDETICEARSDAS